jgi:hypothetical protein
MFLIFGEHMLCEILLARVPQIVHTDKILD